MVEALSQTAIDNALGQFEHYVKDPATPCKPADDVGFDLSAYLAGNGVEVTKTKTHGGSILHCLKRCIFDESHVGNESAIGQTVEGKLYYQCFHDSCKGMTWHDVRQKISGSENLRQYCINVPDSRGNKFQAPKVDLKSMEPVDIFGDTLLTGKPEWPDEACPRVIDDFARDAAERIGVDIEMVAIPGIICAAIGIPDNFTIQPKLYDTSWIEAPRLWGAVISTPGQKKTPAINVATKPIKEIQFRYRDEYREEWAIYEGALKIYEANTKKEKAKEDKPKTPIMRRIWTDELTVESLRETLKENPLGVGIIKDELSGWITSFDVYKNSQRGSSDRPHFCELYQGGPKVFDRVNNRNQFVENWGASILGGIQPGPVQRLMGNITDDGLIARFIFCHAGRSDQDIDRAPHACCEIYSHTIKRLPELKPRFNNDREIFTFNEVGLEFRKQIGNICRMIQILPETGDALSAHLNKWEAIYSRIALVYHIVESVAQGKEPDTKISPKAAEMTGRLMIDFLLPNSIRFYNETLDDGSHMGHAKWIAGYILSRKIDRITPRDIERAYRQLRSNRKSLFKAMHTLYLAGWVEKKENGKRVTWRVNPLVHNKFADRAKFEKERREDERRNIQVAMTKLKLNNSQKGEK